MAIILAMITVRDHITTLITVRGHDSCFNYLTRT